MRRKVMSANLCLVRPPLCMFVCMNPHIGRTLCMSDVKVRPSLLGALVMNQMTVKKTFYACMPTTYFYGQVKNEADTEPGCRCDRYMLWELVCAYVREDFDYRDSPKSKTSLLLIYSCLPNFFQDWENKDKGPEVDKVPLLLGNILSNNKV